MNIFIFLNFINIKTNLLIISHKIFDLLNQRENVKMKNIYIQITYLNKK